MAKITRKTAQQFAISGAGTDVEQFASFEVNGAPNYTIAPATIMALPAWTQGWSATQFDGTFAPYFQDRNAVDLVAFYQLAYLLQQGIAEWDSATPYFVNSVVQNGGSIYISIQDNNVGNVPPAGASNAFWRITAFPAVGSAKSTTRTVLTGGSGTYTPPTGCITLFVRLVGGGGGGGGGVGNYGGSIENPGGPGSAGGNTTFGSLTAGGGQGGTGYQINGAPSPAGVGGTASGGDVNIPGATGYTFGGGANSKLGGSSRNNVNVVVYAPGIAASTNSGSGGSSGGCYVERGGGGGAGGYVEKTITALAASYSYAVGVGGAGGAAGVASSPPDPGGAGAVGIIIIDEFYY